MFNPLLNAASGIRTLSRDYQTNAHTIAKAMAPGFQPVEAIYESNPNGGVSASVESGPKTGETDIAEELVRQAIIEKAIKANLAVLRSEDQMIGVLLDIKA